ncbi:MAG: CotH kinase family protein [Oligoflexia bacterium]|nr:CotH kinase family protein [Oligoflexia bacterium]
MIYGAINKYLYKNQRYKNQWSYWIGITVIVMFLSIGSMKTRIVFANEIFNYNKGSPLPLIHLNTPEDEYINRYEDTFGVLVQNDSSNDIKIKLHGKSSITYKQKSFEVEFINKEKESISKPFFNLPIGKEWIFHSPYVDRSLVRNALAYRLGREMGATHNNYSFAPRSFFTEVSLDDEYHGVYLVVERNELGKFRIDIPKMELDKPEQVSFILEVSSKSGNFTSKYGTGIKYRYPKINNFDKWEKINPINTKKIKKNIQARINSFEDALVSDQFEDPKLGYAAHINVDSFVDYLIMQEVSKNVDGYRRSTWFYAGPEGKITMGPIWDFDVAFGNLNFYRMGTRFGWVVHKKRFFDGNRPTFWFRRLLEDPAFVKKVIDRYYFLREAGQILSMNHIRTIIDEFISTLGEAGLRQEDRWRNTYTNPLHSILFHAFPWKRTFYGNLDLIDSWIFKRLNWMDKHIQQIGYVDPEVLEQEE